MHYRYLSYLVILASVILWTRAELFTAICEVESLLDTHKRVVDDFNRYMDKAKQRLQLLKKHLHVYKTEHEKAMEDIPNYLGNPINAFTLIKRLTTDLNYLEYKIISEHIDNNITLRHSDIKYPAMEDLTGSAEALARLQEVYNLTVEDISNGVLNGVSHSTPMTTSDCYELGRALFHVKSFKYALVWLMEALRKFQKSADPCLFKVSDIMEFISFSHYFLGDPKSALEWVQKVLEVEPEHPRASINIVDFRKSVSEEEKHTKNLRGETGFEKRQQKLLKTQETIAYEALCRGQMDIPAVISKRLHCRYVFGPHPFLRVAPLKMEQLYWRPHVALFHHVLSDIEIQHIKDLAKPRLRRSLVYDASTDELKPVNIRISKSGWLRDEESPVVARVSQRISDMTGLSMVSAESLQVVNYGIGGYYKPHLDFETKQSYNCTGKYGNKLATVMIYMSDVEQGGATVFTALGLSIFPKKGAAVFWMNLHSSGEGDYATRHAGCPVLRGSKWVCNKWIHQGGQEFLKPCSSQDEPEAIKLTPPIPNTDR